MYLLLPFPFLKQKTGQSEKIAYEKAKTDAFGDDKKILQELKYNQKLRKWLNKFLMNIKTVRMKNEIIDKFKQETESLSRSAKIKV